MQSDIPPKEEAVIPYPPVPKRKDILLMTKSIDPQRQDKMQRLGWHFVKYTNSSILNKIRKVSRRKFLIQPYHYYDSTVIKDGTENSTAALVSEAILMKKR